MKVWFYRMASITSGLFASATGIVALRFHGATADSQRVWYEMTSVHFEIGDRSYSYAGIHEGTGLVLAAAELFLAALIWWMGDRSHDGIKGLNRITWSLVVLNAVILAVSLTGLGTGQIVLSALTGVMLIRAAMSTT